MKMMLRAVLTLALTAPLFAGCGDEDGDVNLDSLPIVTADDEKSDKPGSPTFFWVRPDAGAISCIQAPCPTANVEQVNSSNSQLIYKFDWRGMKLSAADTKTAETLRGRMLLYGKYTASKAYGQPVTIYQVTRAYLGFSDKSPDQPSSDIYYSVKAPVSPCMGGTCPIIQASRLGSMTITIDTWQDVNLSLLNMTAVVNSALLDELKLDRDVVAVSSLVNKVATVSQAFRPFGSAPLN